LRNGSIENSAPHGRYAVYLHVYLLDAVPKRGAHRQRIMDFIHTLREHPRSEGDYTDKDSSGRVKQVKIIGDYAVTYWLDDPVRTVMVVDMRPADR
jgi:mRNA-degrading endonuclease RelE of RelBE toxin-antitoxin system